MSIESNSSAILQNLKTSNLNGKICLVKELVENNKNSERRWRVVLPNGRILSIKRDNLKIHREDTSDKKHQMCLFWPESDLVVQNITDWPTNVVENGTYLAGTCWTEKAYRLFLTLTEKFTKI